jgi:hypothetical protein
MDWYQHAESGAAFWQEGNAGSLERGGQTYTNIGAYYSTSAVGGDGMTVHYSYEQDKLTGISESSTLRQGAGRSLSFFEKWSSSNNIFASLSYNILNDAYVSLQPLTFGLVGETTNEFTGGIAHTNLDGTTNYKGIDSATRTATLVFSFGGGSAGNTASTVLKPLGLGFTGRTVATNLTEQLAMKEILANPNLGRVVMTGMKDSRWLGWSKMQYTHTALDGTKITIHYVAKFENGILKAVDDFKFK